MMGGNLEELPVALSKDGSDGNIERDLDRKAVALRSPGTVVQSMPHPG